MLHSTLLKRIVLILTATLLSAACGKKESPKETISSRSFQNEREAFFNSLLEPEQVAAKLQATSVPFNPDLLSDPKNFGSYSSNEVKAAGNLGIYLADMNYCVAYKQPAHTSDLFQAAHALSQAIGIEQSTLDFLMKRYTENLAENDSVKTIIESLYRESTHDLQGTERERLAGIAMAAYQIENLHLMLEILQDMPEDAGQDEATALVKMISSQRSHVEVIFGFLKSVSDVANPERNPNYPYYAAAFEELISAYQRLDADALQNKSGQAMKEDVALKDLQQRVTIIRDKLISVE